MRSIHNGHQNQIHACGYKWGITPSASLAEFIMRPQAGIQIGAQLEFFAILLKACSQEKNDNQEKQ